MDDETECDVSLRLSDLYDFQNGNLKKECLRQILELIRPYASEEDFSIVSSCIYRTLNANGTIRANYLLELEPDLEKLAPGIDVSPLINWLVNIPGKIDDPSVKPQIESLLDFGINAKKKIGICSLAESCDIPYLWEKYADRQSGYCIEYDVAGWELESSIFPVVYQDDRPTNLIIQIVATFVGQMITSMSNESIKADKSQYLRLFLTKNKIWEYQKEWRVLGDAGAKPAAPKITRILVGEKASVENKEKIAGFCSRRGILFSEFNSVSRGL